MSLMRLHKKLLKKNYGRNKEWMLIELS
jgi:hypothetical protein